MPRSMRAVSRREFLKLGGTGLAGATLLGAVGCGGGQGGGEGVKFLTETPGATTPERAAIGI